MNEEQFQKYRYQKEVERYGITTMRERHKNWRANMSEEEKAEYKKKRAEYARKWRALKKK